MKKAKEKKKIGLTTKIFISLILGAIFGIILCYMVPSSHIKDDIIVEGILYVIGQGFIRLMKMLVVPLVFCSLVCGSMSIGDTKKLGTVGVRTLVFYLLTTALAVTVALSVGNIINPGVGLDMSAVQSNAADVQSMEATSLTDTLLNIIPDNPINSLANGNMLQIIVFALIVGIILAIIVFVLGHLVNCAFQTLGAGVNALRLNYVEFFGQFYIGGKHKFEAFKASRKFTKFND